MRLLKRYWVHSSSWFYLSFLNPAFKYWLESNIKKHLKRKGGGLTACMAPGWYEEPVWKWCMQSPSAVVLFMANIESFGQWAFSSVPGRCFSVFLWCFHISTGIWVHIFLNLQPCYSSSLQLKSLNCSYNSIHFQPGCPEIKSQARQYRCHALPVESDGPIYIASNQPSPFMNTSNAWGV